MNAAQIARIIGEARPDDLSAFVAARFGAERPADLRRALDLLIEIAEQDDAEEQARRRQLRASFDDLIAALDRLGLGPLYRIIWSVSDEETQTCCSYCGELDSLGMWKEPVA